MIELTKETWDWKVFDRRRREGMLTTAEAALAKEMAEPNMQLVRTNGHAPVVARTRYKDLEFDEALVQSAEAFLKKTGFSQNKLASLAGYSPATLNRWMCRKPEGNVVKLESALADVIKNHKTSKDASEGYFMTVACKAMELLLDDARDAKQMCLIHSEPGIGKTAGIWLYQQKNPTAVAVSVRAGRGGLSGIVSTIWESISVRGYKNRRISHHEYLEERFTGSGRLIIIDECHLLTRKGWTFIRTFHDNTKCPVAFVGNKEFIAKTDDDPQFHTRLGAEEEIPFDFNADECRRMVEQTLPGAYGQIADLADCVYKHEGHGRALRMQIDKAQVMLKRGQAKHLNAAFRTAHPMMRRKYELPKEVNIKAVDGNQRS